MNRMAVPPARMLLAYSLVAMHLLSALQESDAAQYGVMQCNDTNNGSLIGEITFQSQLIEFFGFSSDETGYYDNMTCTLDWEVGYGCVVYVDLYPCHLYSTGASCADEVSIDAPQQGADPHSFCSGQGLAVQPVEDSVHTSLNVLRATFTTNSKDRALGCGGFIAAECPPVGRKRRRSPRAKRSSTELLLRAALSRTSMKGAKNGKDVQARPKAQDKLTEQRSRLRRAERESYENGTSNRASRRRRSSCPCSMIAVPKSQCVTLTAVLRSLSAMYMSKADRIAQMCDYVMNGQYCFDHYFSWSELQCSYCPDLFDAAQAAIASSSNYALMNQYNAQCAIMF